MYIIVANKKKTRSKTKIKIGKSIVKMGKIGIMDVNFMFFHAFFMDYGNSSFRSAVI